LTDSKLIDGYSRNLNYLRISITDRCNLRCIYCAPREDFPRLAHEDILRYEEILRLVNIAVGLGISKVRVTGGEPLIRKGVYEFLARLNAIEGLSDVSLTTNGVFLKDNIEKIKTAGIKRINISLDTLDRRKYKKITGADAFQQVWDGIQTALKNGFYPIKINMVALRGVNDNELVDFAELSISHPLHVRFIEHMPFDAIVKQPDQYLLTPEIKAKIEVLGKLLPINKGINDGPAERFQFDRSKGEVGFIRPISRHFCATCNRLRLTANGQLRSCLLSDRQEDLRTLLRNGSPDSELAQAFLTAVRHKPSAHEIKCGQVTRLNGHMSSIGG